MPVPSAPTRIQILMAQAAEALQSCQPARAGALAEQATQLQPDHAGAHYILGLASLDLNYVARAIDHLQRATSLEPDSAEHAVHLARALTRAGRTGEAIQTANTAAALPPAGAATLDALGSIYMQCHAFERANTAFRLATSMEPDNAFFHFNHAVTLTFNGAVAQAEAEFEACLRIQPHFWRAYGLRSRLRRQTRDSNHIKPLQALLAEHADNDDAARELHSALGKEYEDLGEFARAFEHLSLGKAIGKRRRNHASEQDRVQVDALIHAFPGAHAKADGYGSSEPIFIVGMPRSGTTLVERIISSHPEVHSAGELLNFVQQVERMAEGRGTALPSLAAIKLAEHLDWNELGRRYVESTRPQTTNKPRFTDKLPHNFLYVGFIAHALPNAKIVCLRRDPMDTCLSNFREFFNESSSFHGYSFDLLDIGRFYIQFDRLMTHWKQVFPERILEIDYETLVAEQASSTRRLLAHCELPWHDACLHFERNQAAVATASTAQVREPIYTTSVRRWEKYGAALEPLERLLNDAGIQTRP